jgi:hypothetical protein
MAKFLSFIFLIIPVYLKKYDSKCYFSYHDPLGGEMAAIGPLELIIITLVGFGGILAPVVLFVILLLILSTLKRIERVLEQQTGTN